MEDSHTPNRPSSHTALSSDDAGAQMHYNPNSSPQAFFFSGYPLPQTNPSPHIVQGPPNATYATQQHAPLTLDGPRPPASGFLPVVTPPPAPGTTQFGNIGKAKITNGHFAIVTDGSQPGVNVIFGHVQNLEISGGQFFSGSGHNVAHLINETAKTAKEAFQGDK